MTRKERITQAVQVVKDTVPAPLPRWVGLLAVILATLSSFGHDQLVKILGGSAIADTIAAAIPVLSALVAAVSHSLNGTGGQPSGD